MSGTARTTYSTPATLPEPSIEKKVVVEEGESVLSRLGKDATMAALEGITRTLWLFVRDHRWK